LIIHSPIDAVGEPSSLSFVSAASVMLKNRLLLSLVTGGVGFGLTLLMQRNFQNAAFTGLMGMIGSQVAVVVTRSQYEDHLSDRREELRRHIRSLQARRAEVYNELSAMQAQYAAALAQLQQARISTNPISTNSSNPWAASPLTRPIAPPPVSWDLANPRQSSVDRELDQLESRLDHLVAEESTLAAALNETLTAKQTADRQVKLSQAELQQLQSQVAEQTTLKQTLNQTILELEQQQQQLQTRIPQLQTEVQTLNQTIAQAAQAAPNPSDNAAAKVLQGAIDQMQTQIAALRSELGDLETQILDRRNQKQHLDDTIRSQQATAATATTRLPAVEAAPSPIASSPTPPKPTKSKAKPTSPKPVSTPNRMQDSSGLSAEWVAFKSSLQPYEFQALCAIALEENPTSVLKRLAESNLTMPEMLIDTINEQALEAIGDLILEAGYDAASTIIAQEYRNEVATLIATHR
jgi:predicted  nucleic acid-binding Zn-ribbon protein